MPSTRRSGSKAERTLGRVVVGDRGGHRTGRQAPTVGPVVGPDLGRVVDLVALGRQLDDQAELRRLLREPLAQLVDQEVGRLLGGFLVRSGISHRPPGGAGSGRKRVLPSRLVKRKALTPK